MTNNKDFEDSHGGSDFEFDQPSWDVGEKKDKATKDGEGFGSDFEAEDFNTVDFGATEFGVETEDEPFAFATLPTQEAHVAEASKGDPSDEFGEFLNDTGEHHGFGDEEEVAPAQDKFEQAFARKPAAAQQTAGFSDFGHDEHADPEPYAPGFDDLNEALDNGEYLGNNDMVDPYAIVPEDQAKAATSSSSSGGKSLISKLIMPIGGAVIGVGVLYYGYTLIPHGTPTAPVVAQQAAPTGPAFPTTLPKSETAGSTSAAKPVETAINQIKAPTFGGDMSAAAPTQGLQINMPDASAPTTPALTPANPTPVMPTADSGLAGAPNQLPVTTPGSQPGILTSPVKVDTTPTIAPTKVEAVDTVSKDQFDALVARIDKMDEDLKGVQTLAESLNNRVAVPSAVTTHPHAVDAPAALPIVVDGGLNPNAEPVASIDSVTPPLKPIIIEGVVLKGVSRDTAWVKAGNATVAVHVGDSLPKGGTAVSIRNYRGDWIVVTSEGIIVR